MKVTSFLVQCSLLVILGTPIVTGLNGPLPNEGIQQHIPPNLLECYNSSFITTKDNLLPMTVNSLIALVRKIEESIGSMDVRTLSSALLTSFRFDGIQFRPELDPQGIPYSVEGNEFPLWKFLYDKVIAKTGSVIPSNILTWVERCSLHRMLSMSVDPYDRGDGFDCSKLDRLKSWNIRYPRDVSKLSDVEMIPVKEGESRIINDPEDQLQSGNFMQDVSGMYPPSACPIENGVVRNKYSSAITPGVVLAGIATGTQPQYVPQTSYLYMQPRSGTGLKRKNYPNTNSNPGYADSNPSNPGYPGSYPSNPGYAGSYPSNPVYPGSYPSNNPNFKPNVIGYGNTNSRPQGKAIFANQYGSNNNGGGPAGGPYGGGSGFNNNNPSGGRGGNGYPNVGGGSGSRYPSGGGNGPNYPRGSGDIPSPSDIDNKFASTLSGELAFVSIWTGPLREGMNIGLDGGWNDTIIPKYYFQKALVKDALTDPRIRGSIDGLLLASNMENWISASRGNLKLSQVLNMYYTPKGVFSTDVKSCKRRDFFEQVAPINILKDQTYASAYVLAGIAPYVLPMLPQYTSYAADTLRSYIPTLRDPPCPNDGSRAPTPAPLVDLHVVLDYNWMYRDVSQILQYIIDNLELWKYGGNFTLINARDSSVVIESSHSPLDFAQNFTYYYGNGGFDFTKVLSELKIRFQNKLNWDKQQYSGGGIPRVVVFMPYSSGTVSDSENWSIKSRIQYFREAIPDVKFYYLVAGSKNNFSPYADDPDKDVFVVTPGSDIPASLDPFISRLITTPRRIISPNCGKYWSGNWYNEAILNGYLDNGEIHYYRIHPNYFFKGANAKITVQAEGNSPVLTVCSSRDNPMPIANLSRSGGVYCKQITAGNRHEMYLKDSDCNSVYYAFQCKPFYFSIANQQAPSKTQFIATCTDQECRDPDMTKYTIRHSGLACYSGVSKLIVSSPILLLALFVQLMRH